MYSEACKCCYRTFRYDYATGRAVFLLPADNWVRGHNHRVEKCASLGAMYEIIEGDFVADSTKLRPEIWDDVKARRSFLRHWSYVLDEKYYDDGRYTEV